MASYPNFGDELIARRWLEFLARHRPDDAVWLDCRHPGTASALFAGLHPNLRVTDAVFRAVEDSMHGSRRDVEDIITDLGTPLYDAPLLALREAGTLHLLGGGFINAVWPHNALLPRIMRVVARISGAPLIATGQGLLPLGEEDLHGFDHVGVRDAPSAAAMNVESGVDDGYLIEELPHRTSEKETELVVCVQSDALEEGMFQFMVDYSRRVIESSGIPRERVLYVEALPGGDHAGYEQLRDAISEDGLVPFTTFWRGEFEVAAHQVWVTSRFHHHQFASLHGARGIALSGKRHYYDVKHGSLIQGGTRWALADIDASPPALEDLEQPGSFDDHVVSKRAEAHRIYLGG